MAAQWKFKVVKRMLGNNGEYFDFPTAGTFATFEDARAYAEDFAREQGRSRVTGARIVVRPRKAGGPTITYRSEDYAPVHA